MRLAAFAHVRMLGEVHDHLTQVPREIIVR